ncbi:MAG: nucleotide exchange factor GrpE [Lachnospiraceae bacterium]|nr:nucleotide exchange factor GrpE [Lachnospiraceae bacterium]MDD7665456.1 nucleotide exchange factor GrpE [Lachnospiraceae bacterium]MDY4164768.1 nucleotide exchange factor GrpE [Lachnospiraceae bacterium]
MSEKKEKKDEELMEPKSEEEASKKAEEKTESKEAGTEKTDDKSKETNEKKPESKKDKKEKTDPKDEKIKSLQDQVLRQMAEFDNFRKRTEKEKASMYSAGAGDVIAKFLPVLDNFERGLADVSDDTDDAFQKGVLAIYKQFKTALDGLGVQEIDALGKTFDPNFHNAVMHVDDKDKGEQEIVEVLQKGYTYNDKVIRYAMVKVAN